MLMAKTPSLLEIKSSALRDKVKQVVHQGAQSGPSDLDKQLGNKDSDLTITSMETTKNDEKGPWAVTSTMERRYSVESRSKQKRPIEQIQRWAKQTFEESDIPMVVIKIEHIEEFLSGTSWDVYTKETVYQN